MHTDFNSEIDDINFYEEVSSCLLNKKLHQANIDFLSSIEYRYNSIKLCRNETISLYALGKFDEMMAHTDKCKKIYQDATFYEYEGYFFLKKKNNPKKAQILFHKAFKLDPNIIGMLYSFTISLLRNRLFYHAKIIARLYKERNEVKPSYFSSDRLFALIDIYEGRYLEAFSKINEKSPSYKEDLNLVFSELKTHLTFDKFIKIMPFLSKKLDKNYLYINFIEKIKLDNIDYDKISPSLPFPSLPFPSLPFPSLPFPSH